MILFDPAEAPFSKAEPEYGKKINKTKLKIEKPVWMRLLTSQPAIIHRRINELDTWFKEHVEPINKMLAEGVEVRTCELDKSAWYNFNEPVKTDRYKALLINIQPIKQETREDKLERVLSSLIEKTNCLVAIPDFDLGDIRAEAKKVLEEK